MNDILRKIRTDLRLSMNGVVSQSMREKGMDYKLNFGVDIPRLRKMAERYDASRELASLLWQQETRELKILATLLFPVEIFSEEDAERWASEIPNQEIREQACINLFQKLSFADKLAQNWINADDESLRTTGYWLLARLAITKSPLTKNVNHEQIINHAISDSLSETYFLRLSAQNALKFLGRNSSETAKTILEKCHDFQNSDNPVEQELFNSLRFEFEF